MSSLGLSKVDPVVVSVEHGVVLVQKKHLVNDDKEYFKKFLFKPITLKHTTNPEVHLTISF